MIYERLVSMTEIHKGWSGDQKYRAEDTNGNVYLLRISTGDKRQRKYREFENMKRVASLNIPMCLPVEFGDCQDGVYSLQSWIEGNDAEESMPNFPSETQYAYGLDAGKILKTIHTIPAPPDAEAWSLRFNRKIDRKIEMYNACPLKYDKGELFLQHIRRNRHLLSDRPQTYQHGDYHIGNMMIDTHGKLTVIDFDRDDCGDPWEEFNRIVWCAQAAPAFAAGMVDGYFDGSVPMDFWNLLALYICSNTLSSLPWAVPFGEEEIQTMRNQAKEILDWYDDLNCVIPVWYRRP